MGLLEAGVTPITRDSILNDIMNLAVGKEGGLSVEKRNECFKIIGRIDKFINTQKDPDIILVAEKLKEV